MACWTPSHRLNQCQLIVNWAFKNTSHFFYRFPPISLTMMRLKMFIICMCIMISCVYHTCIAEGCSIDSDLPTGNNAFRINTTRVNCVPMSTCSVLITHCHFIGMDKKNSWCWVRISSALFGEFTFYLFLCYSDDDNISLKHFRR